MVEEVGWCKRIFQRMNPEQAPKNQQKYEDAYRKRYEISHEQYKVRKIAQNGTLEADK